MNLSRPFIRRPIATTLLTLGLALAGVAAFFLLPVARLPAVDYPVIVVGAGMAGASPADMARTVATPLERTLGAISGVNQMTSTSSNGATRVTLQFELNRHMDDAARDVQAAINAARADLPADLRSSPTYRKANPAAQPFMILALTSDTRTPGQVYDAVSNLLSQRLLQVPGVGDVELGGGSLPAVRIELNPLAMQALGIDSEEVRAAIQASAAQRPKGVLDVGNASDGQALQVLTPPPGLHAADYRQLIVGMRGGAEVRLQDIAQVVDGVQNANTRGLFNGRPAIVASITQQPAANLIQTADAVLAQLPLLRAQLPQDIQLHLAMDRTQTLRDSVREVELTLLIAVALVVLVVGLFLRTLRAALIPAVATVVSLLGTFVAMYALGYSLNNLTLMALTVATGFVVDDAIVVLENITRHMEFGRSPRQAALQGAREVGFTVLTISASLVAVFIPLLFMGGQIGRMFREYAVTLSASVGISLLISLTATPMMCAMLLKGAPSHPPRQSLAGRLRTRLDSWLRRGEQGAQRAYLHLLDGVLAVPQLALLTLAVVTALSAYMFYAMPKGYFPEQDGAQMMGGMKADQSISPQAMVGKLQQAVDIIRADPSVAMTVGFAGGRRAGGGFLSATLKPRNQRPRGETTHRVIERLRPQLRRIEGLQVFLKPAQELRIGGGARSSNSTYQYTLKAESYADLREWTKKLATRMKADARLQDVDDEFGDNGVELWIERDRDAAARLGVSARALNNALYNAFGQRQISTMYSELNQYAVVMEWAAPYRQSPAALRDMRVPGTQAAISGVTGSDAANPAQRNASLAQALSNTPATLAPLTAFARFSDRPVATNVWHDGGELSSTLSFDLAEGVSLQQGRHAVLAAVDAIGMPNRVRGTFAGAAADQQSSQAQQVWLVLAAIVVIYLVLGILYESLIHPLTVLSTIPGAGIGAALALLALRMEFSIMALIGMFLLIGIVKKNAILIIDFALQAQRRHGMDAVQAVRQACLQRFRPIFMTTLAAALGALPLAIGFGQGAELRQPLGVTIIGGLIASQLLTLLTTPVIYVLLDRLCRPAAPTSATLQPT